MSIFEDVAGKFSRLMKIIAFEDLAGKSSNLRIDEIIADVSLSTGTSLATKSTIPLNFRIFDLLGSRTQDLRYY